MANKLNGKPDRIITVAHVLPPDTTDPALSSVEGDIFRLCLSSQDTMGPPEVCAGRAKSPAQEVSGRPVAHVRISYHRIAPLFIFWFYF